MEKVLRGHHLLCVHGFRGMGYSPEFVKTMQGIVNAIRDPNEDFYIRVIVQEKYVLRFCEANPLFRKVKRNMQQG